MKLAFCGGAREVGASCVFVKIDGKNIVLDCGMRMSSSKDQLPDLRMIQENGGVDAIFVSHAHMDHSGSLPVISREYPNAKIYMTHVTKDLVRMLLYDSLKIMEFKEMEIPVFAEVHVKSMLDRIVCFSPGFTFKPFDNELAVTFYNAGHVAGSAGIYISGQEGSLFYSGDFSITPQRTVEGASIPRLRPDIAIFESTYGDRLHASRENEEAKLTSKVGEVIQSGHKILIPAFALGRAQEVILILKRAINRGELPQFKIYVDGMVKDVCRVYNLNPNYLRNQLAKKAFKGDELFYDDNIIAVTGRQPQREAIINSKEPCCIITSSGMLNGGPSQWYAEKLALDEGNFIAVTGYQDEEAPGRQLLELMDIPEGQERIFKFGERSILLKCGIGKYGLSAHADKTEIISIVHALAAKDVFFVHGNDETISSLAFEVQKEYRGRIHAPANGDQIDMIVRNPRKQIQRTLLSTLNKPGRLSENVLKEIWEFALKNYGTDRAFTLEEILFMWNGKKLQEEEELKELANLIHSIGYFQGEIRRPFMYHTLSVEAFDELEKAKSDIMEVNTMLSLAENRFPPEAGLYRKGARFEEGIALLNFNFPQMAVEKYREEIESFEKETGWKVQVNNDCNLSAVQNLVIRLIPNNVDIVGSASYYRNENLVKINISDSINDSEKKLIEKEFLEKTGINIEIILPGKQDKTENLPVQKLDYQMEQNQALNLIDDAFKDKEDKLYKKSLKAIDGEPCIELSFISPVIGNKYRDLIDELESRTRWPIRINPVPNQNELLNVGIRLLQEHGISLKKNLSYFPREMQVRAVVNNRDDEVLNNVKNLYKEKTGAELIIE
jgi:predicted metal-dependent RNase